MTDTSTTAESEQPHASEARLPFEFHGKAGEYFGIWIVNLLLTIATLGVYSAWAKVRTNRYFYGSTRLDGDAFHYAAKPMQILIARLIVFAVLVAFNVLAQYVPEAGVALLIVFFFLFPWLISRALRFQSRVTRWRNVGFDFRTDYWPTFVIMYLAPILSVVTLGLGIPVVTKWTQEWAYKRFSFGDRGFDVQVPLGKLYGLFGGVFVVGVLLYVGALALIVGPIIASSQAGLEGDTLPASVIAAIIPAYFMMLAAALLIYVYRAGVRNIVFRELVLDGNHRFDSTVSKRKYAWIIFSNLIAVAVSLGFLIPWARIRLSRFLAENTFVIPGGPLDQFVESVKETQGVIGEEYVDMEGIDIGIGL
ncbi:DUF898 domain-containing protein [Parvularcula sp. ZS-1/3]|uniref:DUF898 domain-containing protein n=1 Tax=Parvularcula mediterranea TaxID=2732508 RepID=A0A7Y3RPB8_9PROT|nr:YjgN family protein [Parvularcula mediterranea]NNU17216.1 DUF898 domain-containing protein [Parvularcula mediterranea]